MKWLNHSTISVQSSYLDQNQDPQGRILHNFVSSGLFLLVL